MLVVIDNEAVDGGLEIDDALEDTALKAMLGQDGEEAFDSIEPTGRGRPVPKPLPSLRSGLEVHPTSKVSR
jgi:hypothetical protein